jgi:branched-chain amino acid aminotransferase
MAEVAAAAAEGRLLECFGSGTAAVVAPVDGIGHRGRDIPVPCGAPGARAGPLCVRLHRAMSDLHYGRAEHPGWSVVV